MAEKLFKFARVIYATFLLIHSIYSDGFFDFQETLNTFDCSLVNIINYGNMDFGPIQFPAVLIRYFIKLEGIKHSILPTELRHATLLENHTRSDLFKNLVPTEIATNSKPWNCQVHAFLGLDKRNLPEYIRRENSTTESKFVSPPSLKQFWNMDGPKTAADVTTRVVYNILIFRHIGEKEANFSFPLDAWLSSTTPPKGHTGWNHFIWEIETNSSNSTIINPSFRISKFHHICHHCVPCEAYYTTVLDTFPKSKAQLQSYLTNLQKVEIPRVWLFPNPHLLGYVNLDGTLSHIEEAHFLFNYDLQKNLGATSRQFYINTAFLSSILPNTTFIGMNARVGTTTYSTLTASPCGERSYHWTTLPALLFIVGTEITYFHLTAPTKTLTFLSCGKLTKSFFHPLLDLFTAFDLSSWLATLAMSAALSLTLSKINQFIQKYLKRSELKSCDGWETSFSFQMFLMFRCFLEQYSNEFGNQLMRVKFYKWLATIPFVFLVLSNAYRGENITRLTTPNQVIPMNTFDRLVEYDFKICTLPMPLPFYDFK